jgi:uncharacterized protein YidB (DUF937 family)
MGILDDIKAVTNMGSSVQNMHPGALSAVMEYVNSPQVGGLSGLQNMFQQKGLGGIVSSWIGSGENLPISGDQLQSVLHSDALQQIAQKHGIDPSQLTSMMSSLLPHVVDKMTPNGAVDEAASGAAAGS